jgi:hypothetical protein
MAAASISDAPDFATERGRVSAVTPLRPPDDPEVVESQGRMREAQLHQAIPRSMPADLAALADSVTLVFEMERAVGVHRRVSPAEPALFDPPG